MVRVGLGQPGGQGLGHLGVALGVHPDVGVGVSVVVVMVVMVMVMVVMVMVVVVVVLLHVVIVQGGQQGHVPAAINGEGGGGVQRVVHKLLQLRPVQGDDVCLGQLFHVVHRQGVVVQTAGRAGVQPQHRRAVYLSGQSAGQQIEGVGGGHHGEGVVVLRGGRIPGGPGAASQQRQRQQQGKQAFFHRAPHLFQRI